MTKGSFAIGSGDAYIRVMRIIVFILMVLSFGFTQAAFALPVMSSDMAMSEMSMTGDRHMDHAQKHVMSDDKLHHQSKAASSHCICVMCFPALTPTMATLRQAVGQRLPLPINGALNLPAAPEPAYPPPRQA